MTGHAHIILAYALKVDGRTLKFIAEKLNDAGLRPSKATHYEWYSVQEPLRSVTIMTARRPRDARHCTGTRLSLNEIAQASREWAYAEARGQWYAQTVKNLLIA